MESHPLDQNEEEEGKTREREREREREMCVFLGKRSTSQNEDKVTFIGKLKMVVGCLPR